MALLIYNDIFFTLKQGEFLYNKFNEDKMIDMIVINDIKLPNEILNILNKEKYTHKYRDIKALEKNRKILVKIIDEKVKYNEDEYAVFEVYYKIGNRISLLKKYEIDLNYKKIIKIYVQVKELF